MKDKYIVEHTNEHGEKIQKKYKRLKDIADRFNIEIHNLHNLLQYCESDGKTRKYVHPKNKKLYECVKVKNVDTEIIL